MIKENGRQIHNGTVKITYLLFMYLYIFYLYSPIFAYVTRSKTSESFVCRVLSCEDCKAQRVASAIRAICEAKARTKQPLNPTKAIATTQATFTTGARSTIGGNKRWDFVSILYNHLKFACG